ncbi:craniofacial development protein 2-like [Lytechinus pictus]|uniref:craniofacial development protein 2-like n=1 Tax=Lytechinus pictus TaxID=7653 RepID=UPI0030B9E8F6
MNDNDERLIDLCAANDFVIGGTIFPHKDIHKRTCTSPNNRDKNQIDHIMINGTWRRSLLDVKVMRGEDVSSDHYLVIASFEETKSGNKKSGRRQFNVEKLKDPKVRSSFILQLQNRFQTLAGLDDTMQEVNDIWDRTKTAYNETSKTCLGYRVKEEKKDWISADTWETIKKRKEIKKLVINSKSERLKQRYSRQYQEANKQVKKKSKN